MTSATMKILCGPPGTGKTYLAAREAVRIIDGNVTPTPEARYRELVGASQIWPVTFHPSYSYEDFVEGFRPVTQGGAPTYEVRDGPFKLACAATRRSRLKAGETLVYGTARFAIEEVTSEVVTLRSLRQGASDARKFIAVAMIKAVADAIRRGEMTQKDLNIAKGKDAAADQRERIESVADVNSFYLSDSGPLQALVARELEANATGGSPRRKVVLLVDEINRGDLSRILGELITLLEIDKREGASEERSVVLPYSQQSFVVPAELSVIGTMNTTDKSLAVLDFALRRRFEFQEMEPRPDLCATVPGLDLGALLKRWNERIALLRSRDYCIGHAYLMPSSIEASSGMYLSKAPDSMLRGFARVLRTKLIPLLLEYFHESWRKADLVIGAPGLFGPIRTLDRPAYFADVAEVDESLNFRLAEWSDPDGDGWDADRFATAISVGAQRAD